MAKMSEKYRRIKISQMEPGTSGWTSALTLCTDEDGTLFLHENSPVYCIKRTATTLLVERLKNGDYVVDVSYVHDEDLFIAAERLPVPSSSILVKAITGFHR